MDILINVFGWENAVSLVIREIEEKVFIIEYLLAKCRALVHWR